MGTANMTLSILSLLFLGTILVLAIAWRKTRGKLSDAVRQKVEIGNFFDLFSRSLRHGDELTEAMHQSADYIAALIVAQSVCIYRMKNGRLVVAGVSGRYPLSQATIMLGENAEEEDFRRALKEEEITIGEGFIGRVAVKRSSILLTDAVHDERLSEFPMERLPEQVMAVPICRNDELSGVICAVGESTWGDFNQDKLGQLQFAATQVRLIQDLEDSYSARSEQERLNQELGFARQLQSALLPEAVPHWDEFGIHASTGSAKEVNGDFYDFVRIDADRILVVMGDACGKGVPACLLASMARSFIRAAAEHFTTLEALLREVNRNLYRDTDAERFITLGCCLLDRKYCLMEYGRAGHTELIYFVRNHIRRVYPDGTALGLLPDELATFDTICIEMSPGMSVLLYSDGITEALNFDSEEFGIKRLSDEFERLCNGQLAPEEILDGLIEKVREFEPDQHDDRTAILIRRR